MKTKRVLTLEEAKAIGTAAEAEAIKNNWKVSIAIVDDGGHLLHFVRLDDVGLTSVEISQGKARMAALARRATKNFEEMINGGRYTFLSAPIPEVAMLEGGEPIMINDQCLGGVGVSGVKSDQDAQIARAGIAVLK